MASQKDVKNRISSVRNIQKITRAMEMVAAARLRRAEQRIEHLRPYAKAIRRMTRRTVEAVEKIPSLPLLEAHDEEKRVGLLLVTGDRGLAGAFNSQIVRAGNRRATRADATRARRSCGTPPGAAASPRSPSAATTWPGSGRASRTAPPSKNARDIAGDISSQYIDDQVDRVEMIYNGYVSPLSSRT